MRKRLVASVVAALLVVVGAGVVIARSGGSPSPGRFDVEHEIGEKPKEAVFEHRDKDKDHAIEAENASGQQVDNRAYPRHYVQSKRALAARKAFLAKPRRLSRSDFRAKARNVEERAAITTSWEALGPLTPKVPAEATYSGVGTLNSGRVTAMAVDPNCGQPRTGCRLWIAAAGGGIWRTDDALASSPTWTSASTGLASFATGSLAVDPNDDSGDTLYLGTGEPNGSTDSEAGVGLYKTTDGGDHWALVPGSPAVSNDRSIGAISIDPTDAQHIYIGTDLARHGHSSTYGGRRTPPGAPQLGLYESTNGGDSFALAFSRPADPTDPAEGSGADYFTGGVNEIKLDQADPDTVYAALFGYGIWRRSQRLDGDGSFHQVFATRNPDDTFGDRTQFDLTRIDPDQDPGTDNDRTRIYAGDGSDDEGISELWRTDNADQAAAVLSSGGTNHAGWTKLSNPTNGTPGYTSYNYCQDQCGYDDPVVVDPYNPDVVWLGGQMAYGEIPGAEGGTPRSFGRAVVRSTDAGVHFSDMTQDSGNEGLHPDNHYIVMDPFNPDYAFIGSDGGVARIDGHYTDRSDECAGRHLSDADETDCRTFLSSTPTQIDAINDGLNTLQFQDIMFNPKDPLGDIIGGTQDNGTWTGPANWMESIGGDGGPSTVDAAGTVRMHTYTGTTGDVNFHGDNPRTWDYDTWPMDISGEASGFYSPIIADPTVSGTVFAGMQHVWRTQDNGGDQGQLDAHCRDLNPLGNLPAGDRSRVCGDWEPLGPDLTDPALGDRAGQFVSQIQRAPSDHSTMWVATRTGRLFISRNADAPAASVGFGRIDTPETPNRFPSGIAIDPADPNHAWVSYSGYNAYTPQDGHVFEVRYSTASHSATFTDRSYDLGDQPILDVALDAPTGDVYAATDFGVLRLPAGALAWEKVNSNLPPVAVYGLSLSPDGRVLYAATHGRGVYRLQLPSTTTPGGGGGGGGGGAGGGTGTGGGAGPGTGTGGSDKLTLKFISAALHGKHRRNIRVRLVANRPARLVVRIRNEHGKRVGRRTLRVPAGRRVVFRVFVKRKTRIHHRRRWKLQVRGTDAAGHVATATRRFRI
jgi:hypothetical protein